MATMNISLPDELKIFVDTQVIERGYGSSSEYLRDLIRRQRDTETLRNLLMDGATSGPAEAVSENTFQQLRQELRKRT